MKRLCLILAYLFLFTQTVSAMPLLVGQKVVYRGTVTGLRISAVDGTAFIDNVSITSELQNAKLLSSGSVTAENLKLSAADGVAFVDFSAADVLTNNIGKYIVIKDSTGKEIKGWIKAAGSSEAAVTDVLAGWDFTSGWSLNPNTTIDDNNSFTSTVSIGGILKNGVLVTGGLYKMSLGGSTTGTSIVWRDGGSSVNYLSAPSTDKYITALDAGVRLRSTSAGTTDITTLSAYQVTAPSATGVTIVSTKGGTTYNWESKDASFAYNSAITYSIYDRDLTAYADGNHQIEIYDSSNRMLKGVLKAAGSGVTTSTVYTADFSAGVDGWSASWSTGYVVGSFVWDTDHAVLTVAGNASSPSRPYIAKTLSMTVGALQFLEMDYSVVSGSPIITGELIGGGINTSLTITLSGTDTYITSQHTCTGTNYNKLYLYFNGRDYDFVLNINAMRVKAVTAPSSSGATITTLKNGDVYNWSYKNSSFSFNSASYYVIIRAIR